MGIFKVHRYGVRSNWLGRRELRLEAPGKPPLLVTTPPEFAGGDPHVWSPEELLVGSIASCYELTLVAVAERRRLPLRVARIDATGHLERKNGRYVFVVIEVDAELEVDPGHEHEADEIAQLAKEHCIVAGAIKPPIDLHVQTKTADAEAAEVAA
jgi:organic hydroperoxide reductase OsmC/OhrA